MFHFVWGFLFDFCCGNFCCDFFCVREFLAGIFGGSFWGFLGFLAVRDFWGFWRLGFWVFWPEAHYLALQGLKLIIWHCRA
jgi:hypothetical protein